MKAVCWNGVNEVTVEEVPDAAIVNPRDALVRVTATTICGSDLHLYDGYVPSMAKGDILGHEFMGEVVEVGPEVRTVRPGDRVVVPSVISCGACFFCKRELNSLCDNSNPKAWIAEALWGHAPCGIYGYGHVTGGYAGSLAELVRVPFADVGAFKVPEGVPDDQALFVSDAFPTGYMGAEFCAIERGDVVAVWGCGAVGLFAIKSAYLLGAERVIAIDRLPERLALAERWGAETIDYTQADVVEELKQRTGGRGPDACIEAVGMEAHKPGLGGLYDRVKQGLRLESERIHALREAVQACRKGGTVSVLGVFGGFADKVPVGALMNKGLTMRTAQQHGQRYAARLLELVERGDVDPSVVVSHRMPLAEAPRAFEMFKHKTDGCVRVVLQPAA